MTEHDNLNPASSEPVRARIYETVRALEIIRNHASDTSGLGRAAVKRAVIVSSYKLSSNDKPSDSYSLNRYLGNARQSLKDNPALAIDFCEDNQMSPWLRRTVMNIESPQPKEYGLPEISQAVIGWIYKSIKGKNSLNSRPKQIINKLVEKDESGDYIVSNEVFLNFLEWYNFMHIQRQNEVKNQIQNRKLTFIGQIKDAVEEGWMPSSVLDQNSKKLDSVKVEVDDGYELLESQRQRETENGYSVHGLYDDTNSNQPLILIRPIPGVIDKYTYTHEATHAITGNGYEYDYYNPNRITGDCKRKSVGSIKKMFGSGDGGTIMDEAITEHVAQSLIHGLADVVDPKQKSGSYFEFRGFLHKLCTSGVNKLHISEFIAAYFEDDETADQLGSRSAREMLLSNLRNAYPDTNIISNIAKDLKIVKSVHIDPSSMSFISRPKHRGCIPHIDITSFL